MQANMDINIKLDWGFWLLCIALVILIILLRYRSELSLASEPIKEALKQTIKFK